MTSDSSAPPARAGARTAPGTAPAETVPARPVGPAGPAAATRTATPAPAPVLTGRLSDAPANWVDTSRAIRWTLALALSLAALGVFSYWLVAGTHLACQVVTVTAAPGKSTTTQTCGLPYVTDSVFVLAAVVLLLIPDAQKLRIGGFEFERLSNRIEEQTHEISQLRQTVSTTINISSDLINQARNGFRETKDILDRVRGFLPTTREVQDQLAAMDQLERRIDAESWTDLFAGIMTMHALIDAAAAASAAALLRTSKAADTAEGEAHAEEADSVISDYL